MEAPVIQISRSHCHGPAELVRRQSKSIPGHLIKSMSFQTSPCSGFGSSSRLDQLPPCAADRRMRLSLVNLSSELLIMIFEALQATDPRAATLARCVCKRFNAIATPIIYRTVSLNEKIISEEAGTRYSQAVLQNISKYTSHIIVRSDLDSCKTRRILRATQSLRRITWLHVVCGQRLTWPGSLRDVRLVQGRRIEYCIEDLPLESCFPSIDRNILMSMPLDSTVSLKLQIRTRLSTRLHSLKEALLQARRLETFHYQDRGQGDHFEFTDTERLPAFKDLRLESYDWNHDTSQVRAHWDFSQIRSLGLISIPTYPFLASISFPDFAGLRTLHVEDFSLHHVYRREEAAVLLHTLIRDHIRALTTLHITVHTRHFPIDAITAHAASLQVLRLNDYTGFCDEAIRCPTLAVADLASLSQSLTSLHTLELDMDVHLVSTNLFLRTLCRFPRLRTLTLHVHTLLRADEVVAPGSDRDRDFALQMFRFLAQTKRALSSDVSSWKSITVVVGGWRKVMVRRLSEGWKAHNRNGVFAERCFVLERLGGDGEYRPREEMAVDWGWEMSLEGSE